MKSPSIAFRVALYYALFGSVWILSSDSLLAMLAADSDTLIQIQLWKGWAFVLASALVIFLLLRRELNLRTITEGKLEETRKRFHTAFDNLLEGVQIIGHDWRYNYLNDAAQTHNNRPNRELLGKRYMDMWPGIEETHVFSVIKDCLENRISNRLDNRFVFPDGRVGWFNLSIQPIPDGVFIMSVDITERRQADEALRASEAQYRLLAENVSDTVWLMDMNLQTVYMSPSVYRLRGYTLEEINSIPMDRQMTPESLARAMALFAESLSPENLRQPEPRSNFTLDLEFYRKDGSSFWSENSFTLILDADKKPVNILAWGRDITERKQAQEQLRESETRHRIIAELISDYVYILCIGPDNRFSLEWMSGSFERFTGYSATEIEALGGPIAIALPEDASIFRTNFERLLRGETVVAEMRIISKSGEARWAYSYLRPDWDDEHKRIVRVFGAGQDITERKQAEEALRFTEKRFRTLIENSSDEISILSTDGKLLYESPSNNPTLGYARGEFLDQSMFQLIHPEDQDRVQTLFARLVQDASMQVRDQFRLRHHDGSWRCVEAVGTNLLGEPSVGGIVVNYHDITDRKQAEDALRESERQMRAVVTSLDDIVFEFDGQGTYLNVWTANEGLLAQPKSQLLGHRIMDILGEELGRPFADAVKRVLQSGIPESIEYPLDVMGGHRWFVARISPILTEARTYHSASMLVRDITQRKQAEEAIRQGEDRYRQTLDTMLEGCQIIDFDWRYTYVNETAARQGHATRDELVQHTMMEKYPGIENTELFAVLRDCMENRVARQMENEFTYPDGSRGWFELSIQPTPEGIFVLSMDITERKRAETQVQIQMQRLRALNEIDRAISSSMDLRVSLDILLNQVLSQLGVDAASVLLLNTSNLMLEFAAGKGYRTPAIRQTRMRLGDGYAGQVGLERRVIHVPNLSLVGKQYHRAALLKDEEFKQYFGVPLVAKGQLKGVLEVFQRSPLQPDAEWLHYLETLGGQAAIAIENAQMFEGLHQSNLELVTAYDATIAGWSHAMDLRDKETEGHTQRVTELTIQLAERMGLGAQQIVHIRRGALLHDIGKLGVPDPILLKPGKLTDEEWVIMRQHPTYAYEMLLPITYLHPALDIPHYHHEKWDGSGYPHGLAGEQIPLAARLFAVVDVWDALRSDRPYRKSWSADQTRAYLLEQSGKHFEPRVVDAFLRLIEKE